MSDAPTERSLHPRVAEIVFRGAPDGNDQRQALVQQTEEFLSRSTLAATSLYIDEAGITDEVLADLQTVCLLNYRLVHPVDDNDMFKESVQSEITSYLDVGPSNIADAGAQSQQTPSAEAIAEFLVQHCSLAFLETCADYLDDPEDDDENYIATFQKLRTLAISILTNQSGSGEGDVVDTGAEESVVVLDAAGSTSVHGLDSDGGAEGSDDATKASVQSTSPELVPQWQTPRLSAMIDGIRSATDHLENLILAHEKSSGAGAQTGVSVFRSGSVYRYYFFHFSVSSLTNVTSSVKI